MNHPVTVFCIDDHPVVSEGVKLLLSSEENLHFCGSARNADEALCQIDKLHPDLIISDISLKSGISGIELIKLIRLRHPTVKILVLSMHDEPQMVERAIAAGADGYLLKEDLGDQISQAVRCLAAGSGFMSPSLSLRMLRFKPQTGEGPHISRLSDREYEVLRLIGQGQNTRQIAEQLFVSVKTIETYRQRLKEKLNLQTATELIKYAIESL